MLNKKDLINLEGIFILGAIKQFATKRKAAEYLGMSVETLNKYIENLEADVGFKLVYSNDRGSKLTRNGENVAQHVTKLKEILYNVYAISTRKTDAKGEVRLGIDFCLRTHPVSEKIADFCEKNPNISIVSILTMGEEDWKNHAFDICICQKLPDNNDIVELYSQKIRCGYFASAQYLARYGYPTGLDEILENHRLIVGKKPLCAAGNWQNDLKKARNIIYTSNNMYDLTDAVRNGVVISVLPMYFAEEGIVCLDNIKCPTEVNIHLAAYRNTKDIPKNRVVINLYKNILEEM